MCSTGWGAPDVQADSVQYRLRMQNKGFLSAYIAQPQPILHTLSPYFGCLSPYCTQPVLHILYIGCGKCSLSKHMALALFVAMCVQCSLKIVLRIFHVWSWITFWFQLRLVTKCFPPVFWCHFEYKFVLYYLCVAFKNFHITRGFKVYV